MPPSPLPDNWLSTAIDLAERLGSAPTAALDATIDDVLGIIGRMAGADRSYRFTLDQTAGLLWNSHEWCAPGIAPQIDMLQRAPIQDFESLVEPLLAGRSLLVPDVERMPPEQAMGQAFLSAQGIRSLILVPSGRPTAQFVGFDAVDACFDWDARHEQLLRIVGSALHARAADRERVERAERRASDLALLLAALPDASYLIDLRTGALRFVSRQYESMFCRSLQDLYADSTDWLHAVHPEDRDRLLADTSRRNGEPVENQYRVVLPDGSIRRIWHRSVPHRDDLGHPTVVAGIVRDITHITTTDSGAPQADAIAELQSTIAQLLAANSELTDVKRALEATASLFQQLAERTEAVVMVVREGRVAYANPTAERLAGQSADALGERSLNELFGTREAVRILRTVSEGHRGGLPIRRPDGSSVHLDASVQPLSVAGDPGVLIVGIDVSERVSEEQRVAAQLEEMARLARGNLLSQLYAGLAHELNQPLTSIIAYGYGAARRLRTAGVDESVIGVVDRMASEAERAGQIVRQLRALFERRETEARALRLNELVERTTGLMSIELDRLSVDLRLMLDAEPEVTADPAQLEVVLLNLLRNALEALDPPPSPRWIRIAVRVEGDVAVVEVADPGRPIPPEHRSRLFESFFTTRSGGTGTGLYLSRRIAERHGGELRLTDAPPLKVFELRLPLNGHTEAR
jgi:PAS domain S-box-containing protein